MDSQMSRQKKYSLSEKGRETLERRNALMRKRRREARLKRLAIEIVKEQKFEMQLSEIRRKKRNPK
jgi:DNA-binding PadR family transcriptional regulator